MLTARNFDGIRRQGAWDPDLDAYRVVDAERGVTRFFTLRKPDLVTDTVNFAVVPLLCGLLGAFIALFVGWPGAVAGDHQSQLAEVLADRYWANAGPLPKDWTPTEIFTVDVVQDWSTPEHDEPSAVFRDCQLQPGRSADDLEVRCPTGSGYENLRESGADPAAYQQVPDYLDSTTTDEEIPSEPSYESIPDPNDYYYEPQEMFP